MTKADNTIKTALKSYELNQKDVNKHVKAVILDFNDGRGEIVLENQNFKTRRKYADFTEAKKKAGLHPFQIVLMDIDIAIACRMKYIDENDEIRFF